MLNKIIKSGAIASTILLSSCGGSNDSAVYRQLGQQPPAAQHAPAPTAGTYPCVHVPLANGSIQGVNEIPRDYLARQGYRGLIIEIDWNTPTPPSNNLLQAYAQKLSQRTHFAVNEINFFVDKIEKITCDGDVSEISDTNILKAESIVRDHWTQQNLTLHLFWINEFQNSFKAKAYNSSGIVMFRPQQFPEHEQLDILLRQTGKILGLVDQGTPLRSNHISYDGMHCTTRHCVLEQNIESDPNRTRDFCNYCIDDLIGNGGK